MNPYHKNPRQITRKQMDNLRDWLAELGDLSGIVHDLNTDEIIGGNQRGQVFDVNKCEVELVDGPHEPDEQGTVAHGFIVWQGRRYAYRQVRWDEKQAEKANIVANKAGGGWDFDTLANEFEIADLIEWGFDAAELGIDLTGSTDDDAEPQLDRAEELREQWGVEPGQLWRLPSRTPGQEHRLICGDCTDAAVVERVMGGERARLVLTSPPYPGADMWDDLGLVSEIERVGLDALRVSNSVVDDGCPILWNIANTPIGTMAGVVHTTTTTTTKVAADELGLLCYGELIWSKPVQHLTPLSFMMRPVVPNLIHEYIMIFYKGRRKQRENTSGLSDELKALRTKSVWEMSPDSAEKQNHKAPFPLVLASNSIGLYSLESDVTYDPFLGSGTTIIAAENLGRQSRAVEISPAYCAVALQRYVDAFGIEPELIG